MAKTMTKAELLEEIELKNSEIEKLENEIERLEKSDKYKESADELKAMYDSYVEAGFNENQAFALAHTLLSNATKPKTLF